MDRIIGSSGGTTVVTMSMQRRNNLFLSLEESPNPWYRTLADDMRANINKTKTMTRPSNY